MGEGLLLECSVRNPQQRQHIQELLSQIHWLQALYVGGRGLATIDRLLTESLVVLNIGEELVEK